MFKVERGVIKPPNLDLQGLAATRSQAPAPGRPTAHPANSRLTAGDPGGSANLTKAVSPIAPASHRFDVDRAFKPQPPAAVAPGKGAVPINPFLASTAGVARAVPIDDDAKQVLNDRNTFPHRI
jgi:hypothetical protein